MDTRTLISAMSGDYAAPVHDVDYATMLPGFEQALRDAQCTTPARVAMFAAQVGAESGSLRWMEELADGSEYDRYEHPSGPWQQLGNTQAGDGRRYKGRGPIQLTGRHNYGAMSEWAYAHRLTLGRREIDSPQYFVDHPERVAWKENCWLGTVWYWTKARDVNSFADAHDIEGATVAVNGGLHNLAGRRKRWQHCLTLGAALMPADAASSHPRRRSDMKILVVDRAECRKNNLSWPGYFKHDGYALTHIDDAAELRALRVSGWPAPHKISMWTYKQLGGK